MRWSSETPRAKVLKGVEVEPYRLEPAPPDEDGGASAGASSAGTPSSGAPAAAVEPWDGRERRSRPGVPEPWDGRDRRSGHELVTARETAFQEGFVAGRRAAEHEYEEARDAVVSARAALTSAVEQLAAQRAAAVVVAEDEISELAFSVAEAVLQRELELSKDPGGDALARALALVPAETDVVVRMHPDDAAAVPPASGEGRRVIVQPDPAVERGGCIAEAGSCRVDTQPSTALARVREVLCAAEDEK